MQIQMYFTGTDYYFQDAPRVTITYENDCLTSYNPGFEFFYYTLDGNGKKQWSLIFSTENFNMYLFSKATTM